MSDGLHTGERRETAPPADERSAAGQREFAGKLFELYRGAMLTVMIRIGHQTGLFDAAAQGPATSAELAERAGLQERYVREWLGAMTTAEVFDYDPARGTYALPPERAAALTGNTAANMAPLADMIAALSRPLPRLLECFRSGGGVPYSEFRPAFTEAQDDVWRRIYDEQLIDGFLAAVPGLTERLRAGMRVLDIGCGTGHALNLIARAFPASTCVGYDIGEDAIAAARAEAQAMGLANAEFAVQDVSRLPTEPPFDLITAFDAVHDQVAPETVLRRAREALTPDGTFVVIDFKFSSHLERNLGNPYAPFYYGVSTLHCMTVSLADGGAGLGTVWGIERAREMFREAGFGRVDVLDAPRPQNCIYVCRP